MGWYVNSIGEVRQADDYPQFPIWSQVPDPAKMPPEALPEPDDNYYIAVLNPIGTIVGVALNLVNGQWVRNEDVEIRPIHEIYREVEERGEEGITEVWHKNGKVNRTRVVREDPSE